MATTARFWSAACVAAIMLGAVAATSLTPSERILQYLHARGEALEITKPNPLKVVYIDWRDVNWNAPDQNVKSIVDGGFNVVVLAFYLTSGPTDMLQAWASVSNATRAAAVSYAHSKGAIVMLSAGGATESPYSQDAVTYGEAVAKFAHNYNLDGVDFDLENLSPGCTYNGMSSSAVVDWMVTVSTAAASMFSQLGGNGFISHAPQSPYFGAIGGGGSNSWPGASGCYSAVYAKAASAISWFNTQFYNQGATCYTSFEGLFVESNGDGSCPSFPGTSVKEIVRYGVPASVLVVGKPLETADAGNGYVSPSLLHTYIQSAVAAGISVPGVMAWSWDTTQGPAWIAAVYP